MKLTVVAVVVNGISGDGQVVAIVVRVEPCGERIMDKKITGSGSNYKRHNTRFSK